MVLKKITKTDKNIRKRQKRKRGRRRDAMRSELNDFLVVVVVGLLHGVVVDLDAALEQVEHLLADGLHLLKCP